MIIKDYSLYTYKKDDEIYEFTLYYYNNTIKRIYGYKKDRTYKKIKDMTSDYTEIYRIELRIIKASEINI